MRSFRRTFLAVVAVLAWTGTAAARKEIADVYLDASGTHVEISSVFDPPPPTGYAPVRVSASSGLERETQWALAFESSTSHIGGAHRHVSEFAFTVAPKAREARVLLVPLSVAYGGGYGGSAITLQINLRVSGLPPQSFQHYENRGSGMPAIAISKTLADNALSRLESEVETRLKSSSRGYGDSFFGSRFEAEDLPEDWRGLSGFDFLMISQAEWQSLNSAARLAAVQWARLGGHLHIYMGPGATAAALDLPQDILAGSKPVSLGRIDLVSWDGKHLPTDETVDRYWNGREREKELTNGYTMMNGKGVEWLLLRMLGDRSFASWQVLLFLVVFGILVGPVNLFVLAPASRRHRLFVTTPLLSVGASVVMVAVLLLQDGVGGIGRRFVALNFEPGETGAYVTQEQVSRTGLLLGTAFEVKHKPVLESLALPDKPWVKLKSDHDTQTLQISQREGRFSGNIFQSRTEQAQILRAVIPTRARVELKAGQEAEAGVPQLVSALGFTAQELYYVDEEGNVWKAMGPAVTGQVISTEKSDLAALKAWWREVCKKAGPRMRERLSLQIGQPRAKFFARAAQAPDFVLDTLNSIRWSEDEVVVFGAMPKS